MSSVRRRRPRAEEEEGLVAKDAVVEVEVLVVGRGRRVKSSRRSAWWGAWRWREVKDESRDWVRREG